jgi:hypothetical protein
MGMNIDHRYMTYYNTQKDGPKILVRITTKNGLQISQIYASDFDGNEALMFQAADRLRRHILKTGRKPTEFKIANEFAEVTKHPLICSKVAIAQKEQTNKPTVPNKIKTDWNDVIQKEQPSKSIFTRLKMWVFG